MNQIVCIGAFRCCCYLLPEMVELKIVNKQIRANVFIFLSALMLMVTPGFSLRGNASGDHSHNDCEGWFCQPHVESNAGNSGAGAEAVSNPTVDTDIDNSSGADAEAQLDAALEQNTNLTADQRQQVRAAFTGAFEQNSDLSNRVVASQDAIANLAGFLESGILNNSDFSNVIEYPRHNLFNALSGNPAGAPEFNTSSGNIDGCYQNATGINVWHFGFSQTGLAKECAAAVERATNARATQLEAETGKQLAALSYEELLSSMLEFPESKAVDRGLLWLTLNGYVGQRKQIADVRKNVSDAAALERFFEGEAGRNRSRLTRKEVVVKINNELFSLKQRLGVEQSGANAAWKEASVWRERGNAQRESNAETLGFSAETRANLIQAQISELERIKALPDSEISEAWRSYLEQR